MLTDYFDDDAFGCYINDVCSEQVNNLHDFAAILDVGFYSNQRQLPRYSVILRDVRNFDYVN